MPQLQLPIFPAGAKCITNEIAAECRDKQVVYLYGSLPVFQHAEGDLQSFRLITSQPIDMGAVRQVDIVNAFGVPLPTVKRYLRLLRDDGSKAFFAEPKRAGSGAGQRRESQYAAQSDSCRTFARRQKKTAIATTAPIPTQSERSEI